MELGDLIARNTSLSNVSIIMPIRNEFRYIRNSLGAILRQNYPSDRLEILIVDGLSNDGSRQIVNDMIGANPQVHVVLLDNDKQIFSTGFNIGLKHAQGDIVVMLGGHTEIAPDYVWRSVESLGNPDVDCVGGSVETIAQTRVGEAIALAMSTPFGVGGVAFRTQKRKAMWVDTVAFGAYKRQSVQRCGFLDEELVRNQDDEYNYRLRELGGRILLVPDIHVRYYSRSSLGSLWHQYFQYGYWKVRVMQKHPFQMRFRHFVPPLFVAGLFCSLPVVMLSALGWIALAPWLIYILAVLVVSFSVTVLHRRLVALLLVLTYPTLHLSYGLGFLIGLIKFANRWGDKGFQMNGLE